MHNTISNEPLVAEIILETMSNEYVVLVMAMMFPMKKIVNDSKVSRVRSILAVSKSSTGAERANINAKREISNPACPMLTSKSVAIKSKIPPIINSTNPTTNAIVVSKYTRLSIVFSPPRGS